MTCMAFGVLLEVECKFDPAVCFLAFLDMKGEERGDACNKGPQAGTKLMTGATRAVSLQVGGLL